MLNETVSVTIESALTGDQLHISFTYKFIDLLLMLSLRCYGNNRPPANQTDARQRWSKLHLWPSTLSQSLSVSRCWDVYRTEQILFAKWSSL